VVPAAAGDRYTQSANLEKTQVRIFKKCFLPQAPQGADFIMAFLL
jgi:hypothetical protein